MAVSNGTTKSRRRMSDREFALLCPKADRDSEEHVWLTIEAMEQLAAARKGMGLLSRRGADGALIEALAADLRQAEEKLARALFDEEPRRRAH